MGIASRRTTLALRRHRPTADYLGGGSGISESLGYRGFRSSYKGHARVHLTRACTNNSLIRVEHGGACRRLGDKESGCARGGERARHVVARVRRRSLGDDDCVAAPVASGPAERFDGRGVSDREDDLAGRCGAGTVIGQGGSYGLG